MVRRVPGPPLLRRLLRRSGFDLKRFAPLVDPHLARQRVLASHGIDLVVDGGANEGQYASRLREYGYRGRLLSVEPGSGAHEVLAARAATDAGWDTVRAALGREAGTAELRLTRNSVSSSLLEARAEMGAVSGGEVVGTERVPVRTLADVLGEHAAGARAVAVKLDVQGAELAALEGAAEWLGRVELLELELAPRPLYEGQPPAHELAGWLAARGFHQVGAAPNTLHPESGHLLELDALFARG